MEGPSIHLAAEQLQPFVGRRIKSVGGNSRIGIERLDRRKVVRIFAWGKHLVFQFDTFALRLHFLLWGTFAATVRGVSVTGDYRRTGAPRLELEFPNGEITIWSAALRFLACVFVQVPRASPSFYCATCQRVRPILAPPASKPRRTRTLTPRSGVVRAPRSS